MFKSTFKTIKPDLQAAKNQFLVLQNSWLPGFGFSQNLVAVYMCYKLLCAFLIQ